MGRGGREGERGAGSILHKYRILLNQNPESICVIAFTCTNVN